MVRCPKCGTESPEDARFCRACGERLAGARAAESAAPTAMTVEDRARRMLENAFRLSEEGKLQPAIQACQQAISLNPTSTSAHSLLGTLLERLGDREGAIREYEQVLTLSPGSTVERRRLNELMGVPAAAAPMAVSARTARLAVTGGFVMVALVLVAAIVFTTQEGVRRTRGEARVSRPALIVTREAGPSEWAPSSAPPRLQNLGRVRTPRPAVRPRRVEAAPRPRQRGYAQWLGRGAFLLPAGTERRFQVAGSRVRAARPRTPVAPMEGAVLLTGPAPAVKTPRWRYPVGLGEVGYGGSPRLARNYYFQGDYHRAIDVYRGYLSENPGAGAATREELAWVYAEAGDRRSATREYRGALSEYREDLNRGHNVEAARHGVRTCESAIRALETE